MKKIQFKRLTFIINIFHCYEYEFSCQILYSSRRFAEAELTDDEACERN